MKTSINAVDAATSNELCGRLIREHARGVIYFDKAPGLYE